jgi:hypothetical protein
MVARRDGGVPGLCHWPGRCEGGGVPGAGRLWARAVGACCVVSALSLGLVVVGAAPAPAQTDSTLAGAAALIGFIPKDVRYDCTIDPAPTNPSGSPADAGAIRVGLVCPGADGVSFVEYYLFTSSAAMNSFHTQSVNAVGSALARDPAGNCPSDDTWDLAGQVVGQVACYYTTQQNDRASGQVTTVAEYPVLDWTYDAENILVVAALAPGNDDAAALQTWWHDKAGPTKTADKVTGVVTSDAGQKQYQRALLTHIPPVTRKSCTVGDVFDPANAHYNTRLWIRAVASCSTNGGADAVYYESLDPSAVAPYFASLVTNAQSQESSTQPDRKCPDAGNYTSGSAKQRRTVGQYVCFTDRTGTYNNGASYAEYEWSYPKLGVIAYAFNNHDDPDALIAWFDGPKSGPQ